MFRNDKAKLVSKRCSGSPVPAAFGCDIQIRATHSVKKRCGSSSLWTPLNTVLCLRLAFSPFGTQFLCQRVNASLNSVPCVHTSLSSPAVFQRLVAASSRQPLFTFTYSLLLLASFASDALLLFAAWVFPRFARNVSCRWANPSCRVSRITEPEANRDRTSDSETTLKPLSPNAKLMLKT